MKSYLKVFIALAVIGVTLVWAVNSVRSLSYAGNELTIAVGAGPVALTNPSDVPVTVQLVSPGARVFAVTSSIAGVSGSSATQGTGQGRSQLFEFAPPSGESQFTVTRGTKVSLVANTDTNLEVTMQPLSEGDARTTMIVAAVVILGAVYYISRTTNHRWIAKLRGTAPSAKPARPSVFDTTSGQSPEMRSYGDNRTSIPE